MDYAAFIEELRPLLDLARTLFNDQQTHENPKFRKWRHNVTALMSAIEDLGYPIDCSISSRRFDIASYGPVSRSERIARYNRDLQDTINEIESIIEYFEKFGDPRGNVKTPQTQKLLDVAEEAVTNIPPRTGTLKEKFESHPVVWGLTLLVVGFSAGFAARSYFPSETNSKPPSAPANCRVEGADRIEEAHHIRMETLQKQLMKLEAGASDRMLIRSDQDKYREAADRVRQDIATENSTYQAVVQQLSKMCQ